MMPKICLDAGHYGKVNRSPVVPSYYESDMSWKLHLLLKSELEKWGFSVVTTRAAQANDLELTARGRKAAGCDLFLSLHSNAVGTESVDRPVGIYLIPDSSTNADEKSREIAALLAKTIRDIMQTNQAEQIFCKEGNDRNGDGKADDYYGVLYGAHSVNVPGVILEHGFHTNQRCAQWLLQEENLKKLAVAEAAALAAFFGMEPADPAPSDSIYRVRESWDKPNTQQGAFASLENAVSLAKSTGLNVYDGSGRLVYPTQEVTSSVPGSTDFQPGDRVKVKKAEVYGGGTFQTYYDTYEVIQASGDRVVIGVNGTVTAAVHAKNLEKVSGGATGSSGSNSSGTIQKGDRVKVLKNEVYGGGTFKVYYDTYDVIQVSGDRAVIGVNNVVTAAVHVKNLQKV